mmetsp:Transcript_70648/g.206838  ORF Transcript_70648/g.206838 Transcript_70648/m.206838 type:complete len:436 (-) Transcript_70648:320-1627(-)
MTSLSSAPAWSCSPREGLPCFDEPTSPALSCTSTTDRSVHSCDGAPSSSADNDHPGACPDGHGEDHTEDVSRVDDPNASLTSPLAVSADVPEEGEDQQFVENPNSDDYVHEMDKACVPDELLDAWAETEAKLLETLFGSQAPLPWDSQGGFATSSSVMARARQVCLMLMERYITGLNLGIMAWFEAASVLDAYLAASLRKGRAVRVETLPEVCTVIIRMQWKEDPGARSYATPRDYFPRVIMECFRKNLADMIESEEKLGGNIEEVFLNVELEILQTLGWQVNFPCLAKWLFIFFRRLACSVDSEHQEMVTRLRLLSTVHLYHMTLKLVPSADLPPQRVARGLLVVYSMLARLTPTTPPLPALQVSLDGQEEVAADVFTMHDVARGYLQTFERVAGAPEAVLSEDCQLAFRALQTAGVDVAGIRPHLTGVQEHDI